MPAPPLQGARARSPGLATCKGGAPLASTDLAGGRPPQGAFWGSDLVGAGGLLDRLYAGLGLPRRAWPGLKRLPEVGGIADRQRPALMALVGNHMKARRWERAQRSPSAPLLQEARGFVCAEQCGGGTQSRA